MKRCVLNIASVVFLLAFGSLVWEQIEASKTRSKLGAEMIHAIEQGHYAEATSLLERGADPNASTPPRLQPGLLAHIRSLLRHPAPRREIDALILSVGGEHSDSLHAAQFVDALLDNGADTRVLERVMNFG